MARQYTAKERTIGELLSFTSPPLQVPRWQRSYSWRTQEVTTFWEDLMRFSDRYPGEGLTGQEYFLGSVVLVAQEGEVLEVLDGQQRLATATVLLSALRDVAQENHYDEAATTIGSDYIAKKDLSGATTYKLRLNHYDELFFRAEVQTPSKDGDPEQPAKLASHKLIRKARQTLLTLARAQFEAEGGGKPGYGWLTRMYEVLTRHASVVAVTSTDPNNAAAVFETLNDRGIGLSTPDLLRNLLLLRARNEEERTEIVEHWEEIFGLGGEGISVDDFLRHYYVSHRGDLKSKALYREYRDQLQQTDAASIDFTIDLAIAANFYRDLATASFSHKRLSRALQSVQDLNAKVLMPALLSAAGEGSDEQRADLAEMLLITYVRHTLIGNLAGSDFETVAFNLARDLRTEADYGRAIAILREFAPSDEEFQSAFARATVSRRKSAQYLLRALELARRGTDELDVAAPELVHVEHIYPQTPRSGTRWDDHDEYIDRLGNLTLFDGRMNSAQRNAPFPEKKQNYERSEITLTQELLNREEWTPEQVDERQRSLAREGVKVWSLS
jgi:hypothetical protein